MSIEEVYRACFEPVYRYALRLTGGDRALADDITSDTFFAALRSLERFRGESSLKSWLCQIAKHRYIDHLRRAGRLVPLDSLPELSDPDTPEDALLRQEAGDAAWRAVDALPAPYREVFLLRARGQLDFKAIGQLFGRSANWACVCHHRARQKLMDALKEEET